jgi:hydrogenase maturation protein HypF
MSEVAVDSERRRVRARVGGTVQGVGFRPYVYRLAANLSLSGFVLNDEQGVLVEIEGAGSIVERFLERLPREAPPLARVERVWREELPPLGSAGFEIVASTSGGVPATPISPDTATCPDCLAELFNPNDRRFRYPFINCTNCGPRFTIVRGIPYDRARTTMAEFPMCPLCRAEYDDVASRRFHAQPNACAVCGPSVRLTDCAGGRVVRPSCGDPVEAAARALMAGSIVAIKGLGGFHLACRADGEDVVARLRGRKHREDKPFALMVPSLEHARDLVEAGELEETLLLSRERPIVLCRRKTGTPIAASVAPRSPDLGLMLPYSPLHHLLMADAGRPLVMTSGNVSDEPIAYQDDDALERLGEIADLFLLHDRPIQIRTDDSVVRVVATAAGQRSSIIRRSRGFVPGSLDLPLQTRPVLACGAELKSTFCLAKGRRAWVGHHIGDLKNYETFRSFRDGIEHFERLFAVQPEMVAHDLHPDYLSTAYALERSGVVHLAVQHHHAHLAGCLAEYGEMGPAIGAIYDGTGYGSDGAVWGGELLFGGLARFERVGHLWPVRLPGGDRAIQEPWRMACAWLVAAFESEPAIPPGLRDIVAEHRWHAVAHMARTGVAAPITTSVGRLFDAVAALCGLGVSVNYEGQAAVELEAIAASEEKQSYPMPLVMADGATLLDGRETVRAVTHDLAAGITRSVVAARFHDGLADATARACEQLAGQRGTNTVVLSGGVFQNRRLLERAAQRLGEAGLRVLTPGRLPANDGGIAYGQAAVAAAQ